MFEGRDREKPSKRLFYIINKLKVRSCSITELTGEFNVSKRTLFRDFNDIKKLFGENSVKIEKNGCYSFTPLNNHQSICFNIEELSLIFSALENYPIKSAYHKEIISDIASKIRLENDMALVIKSLEYARYLLSSEKYKDTNFLGDVYKDICDAISKKKKINIFYRALNNEILNFTVSGMGWVCYKGFIYLIGFSEGNEYPGPFRIERIEKYNVLKKNADIPAGFTINDYIKKSFGISYGPIIKVRLLFSSEVARAITDTKRHLSQKIEIQKDGSVIFEAKIAGLNDIKPWVLSFGENVRVIEPKELKNEVLKSAKKILEQN